MPDMSSTSPKDLEDVFDESDEAERRLASSQLQKISENCYRDGYREGVSLGEDEVGTELQKAFDEGYRAAFKLSKELSELSSCVVLTLTEDKDDQADIRKEVQALQHDLEEAVRLWPSEAASDLREEQLVGNWMNKVKPLLERAQEAKTRWDKVLGKLG